MAQLLNTLESYLTRTRRYIKQEDPNNSQWSQDLLRQFINAWYRFRCTELVMAHEGYFTNLGTRDIIADQTRYAWPSSMTRLLKMEIVRSDGGRDPLPRWERHFTRLASSSAFVSNSGDGYSPSYRPVGSGFVLEPTPGETVSNGLYLEWNGTPDELTDDGDGFHSDFPQEFSELVVIDAAIACFDQEGMQESGQRLTLAAQRLEWADKFEQFIQSRIVSTQWVEPFIPSYSDY